MAEFHDLFVVIGIYSLTGREVTTGTIAAVLTILGYSLYDTVIVFDRIRENAPKMSRVPYGDMVNRSIWETLTRSMNTTLMTLMPVVCLLLFGGATLKDFAFALLVGVASGAYSSIFVASPVLTHPQGARAEVPQARRQGRRSRLARRRRSALAGRPTSTSLTLRRRSRSSLRTAALRLVQRMRSPSVRNAASRLYNALRSS